MIRINLIRGKRKKRREFNVGSLVFLLPLVVLAGVLYFHHVLHGKIGALETNINNANAEVARLKKSIDEVESFKARRSELQRKVDIISSLQQDRVGPVRYFEALSLAIPEKSWIDKLEIRGRSISVSGVALNNTTVANFMTALAQTGRFRDVLLGSADQAALKNTKLVRFNLTFQAVD